MNNTIDYNFLKKKDLKLCFSSVELPLVIKMLSEEIGICHVTREKAKMYSAYIVLSRLENLVGEVRHDDKIIQGEVFNITIEIPVIMFPFFINILRDYTEMKDMDKSLVKRYESIQERFSPAYSNYMAAACSFIVTFNEQERKKFLMDIL